VCWSTDFAKSFFYSLLQHAGTQSSFPGRLLYAEIINDLVRGIQIDPSESPQRLADLAFAIKFDQQLPLARPARGIRKYLEQKWIITRAAFVQLLGHLAQDRPLSFLEDDVPKAAVIFKGF
jgi:hypothetical protein